MARRTRYFWRGFGIGAAAGVGSVALINLAVRARRPVVRLEKSIQIGRPVAEVFNAWTNFERLAGVSDIIEDIRREGNRSRWQINIDGRRIVWDSEIEQYIPNQAVGWKSVGGPKHTGRVDFSPLGDDTLVHIVMNYQPPSILLRPFSPTIATHLDNFVEKALRDFKASLEGKGQEGREQPVRATGTYGPGSERPAHESARTTGFRSSAEISGQSPVNPGGANPVEFTRPPETKS